MSDAPDSLPAADALRPGYNVPLAALMMIGGTSLFAGLGALVKLASDEATPMQAVLYRSFFSGLPLLVLMRVRRISFTSPRWRVLLVRGGAGFIALYFFMWALGHLGLADVQALQQTSPVMVAVLGIVVLRERPKPWFYPLALVCLIGAVLVIRPTRGVLSLPSAVPLLSAFFSAVAYVSVSSLSKTESSIRIVAWFVAVSTIGSLPFCVADWRWLSLRANVLLGAAGLMATAGQLLMTSAYKRGPAWIVAAFAYSSVPVAWLLGIVIWGDHPDMIANLGILLIAAGGVALVRLARPTVGPSAAVIVDEPGQTR